MRHLLDVETTEGMVTLNPEHIEHVRPGIDRTRPDLFVIRMVSGYQFITAQEDVCAEWASAMSYTRGDNVSNNI